MVNSKRKGNEAERQVVKTLKEHFKDHFERRSMGVPGADIVCPPHWIYAIEVKNDKRVKAIHLLGKPLQLLRDYWDQASAQADAMDLSALLVVKADGCWFCSEDGVSWTLFDSWCQLNVNTHWNQQRLPV